MKKKLFMKRDRIESDRNFIIRVSSSQ